MRSWAGNLRLLALLICLPSIPVIAQNLSTSGTITIQSASCSGAGAGFVYYLLPPNTGTVALTLSGTWSGTVQFVASVDGVNWSSIAAAPLAGGASVTSSVTNGTWTIASGGAAYVCAYASSYSSGRIGVSMASSGGGGVPGAGGGSSGGVWQREGTILSPNNTEQFNASEPTLLYEGNPQLLSGTTGNIFKMWWDCGYDTSGLCYAESIDGEVWTRAASPVIARSSPGVAHGIVVHNGSTYYYFGVMGYLGAIVDAYTSSDGINWTSSQTSILDHATGTWPGVTSIGNVYFLPNGGSNWLYMVEAAGASSVFSMGVGSCTGNPPSMVCTAFAGNPVIQEAGGANEAGGPEIHLINGTYYVWGQCNTAGTGLLPTDLCRWHSNTFLAGPWTADNGGNPVIPRATQDEGAGTSVGQIADPSMVQVNNTIYMAADGVIAQNGSTPDAFHLQLLTAPLTFSQLVHTNEGNATSFHRTGSFGALNLSTCVYWDNNFNRVPCANTNGAFNIGAINIIGGAGYPSFAFNNYFNGSSNMMTVTGYAAKEYLDVSGGVFHWQMTPSSETAPGNAFPSDFMTYQAGLLNLGSNAIQAAAIGSGVSGNTDLRGHLTLASGSATYTFAKTYTVAPTCVATDTTTAAAVKTSATTTVLTLTGTGTDTLNYICAD